MHDQLTTKHLKKTTPVSPSRNTKGTSLPGHAISEPTAPDNVPWILGGVAAVVLASYAFFFEPRLISWPLNGHGAFMVLLFATLAVISCLAPITAPRYAERIRLTPLVALSAILVLPPVLATVPLIIAAAMAIVSQPELTQRRSTLSHFATTIMAQVVAGSSLIALHLLPLEDTTLDVPRRGAEMAGACGVVLFGIVYLAGLLGVRWQEQTRKSHGEQAGGWFVSWTNEALIYIVGAPFAAMLAFAMLRDGGVLGGLEALGIVSAVGVMARFLVERKMLRRQMIAMERLTECAAIGRAPNGSRLIDEFLERSRSLILYDRARVWLYNDGDTLLQCAAEYPARKVATSVGSVRRMGEELIGRVAERRTPMIVADVRRDARHSWYTLSEKQKSHMGPVAQLLLPLVASGEVMGVVEFERRLWGAYSGADRDRIQHIATIVAMGMANMRRHQDVVQLALTDGLTGLYNKRHIMQILNDELRRAERYGHTLSVLMMDLDSFKHYNDTYGHQQGDALLTQLAGLIQDSIRSSDHAGRYGGEEFIVLMPETSKEATLLTAERIRQRIESTPFPGKSRVPDTLPASFADCFPETEENFVQKTISIGVANYPFDAKDVRTLVGLADEALYVAKRSGRNQVVAAGEADRVKLQQ